MTDAPASPPASESPRLSARLDENDLPWPLRPWLLAAVGTLAGLIFYGLVDRDYGVGPAPLRDALAAFVAVATVVFLLGVERRRWHWAAGFALAWGAVIGLIAWHAAGYNVGGSPFEWPFWSGILAVLVATPLFQTRRDVAPDWRFWRLWQMPYARLHSHAWADAVIGAAGLAFVGITFLLIVLIGQMFKLIGIDLIERLLNGEWFGWMLAGAAFGGSVGLLRERDRLVATLQRLVMIVLAVLAPVLAAALVLFLLSLIGTGLTPLWESGFSTAALMMAAAAFAVLLANAAVGNGRDERAGNRLLHVAAAALVAAVLPLAAIAFYSMYLRVVQYGWTPERIWGVIAAAIALAYGAAGLWSVVRGRHDFDELLRPLQQKLAIGLMLLATILALPVLDFGAISTRDQLARLTSGAVKADKFDWAAMAFDFGPAGRRALEALEKSPQKERAGLAKIALKAKYRGEAPQSDPRRGDDAVVAAKPIEDKLRVLPAGAALAPDAYAAIDESGYCLSQPCIAYRIDDDHIVVARLGDHVTLFERVAVTRQWRQYDEHPPSLAPATLGTAVDLAKATVEVRPVARRQLFVNGKPLGDNFP
ncbi:DUF4153 domain-containing protein [Sphingopyxis lindanitolerans]|uniref:DUF4153 domain-containing protein n=1 Tax=Sphingopyxis lindanitolerans TaxID=2054227 RepID=A0A2S8B2W5_9SPHN|nr:DUF4153 domain-containing protein [Sphingopyxis lindanitolerans]PQM26609.1 DUF4153 domain-containing protein [Sphingopyxis lindanitolerans]